MNACDETLAAAFPAERLDRWYGVYPAVVVDVRDPDGQGRVQLSLPWAPDDEPAGYRAWARLATLMAGGGRGTWFVPEPGDEVLVSFEAGDPRRPYVVGALWNGQDRTPQAMDGAGRNDVRLVRSRSGHEIRLDDTPGQEQVVVTTPGGQRVTLSDAPAALELTDANGNTVRLAAGGITITVLGTLTVSASTIEMTAGSLTVSAGMSQFSGVAKADTVISNSVVSAAYTPGAGNIW